MNRARRKGDWLMQMRWRTLLRLMQRGLLHTLSFYLAMPAVLFLFDLDMLSFPRSFPIALFCHAGLASHLTEAWERKARTLGWLWWTLVGSMRLRRWLSRRLLAETSKTGERMWCRVETGERASRRRQGTGRVRRRLLWVMLRRAGSKRRARSRRLRMALMLVVVVRMSIPAWLVRRRPAAVRAWIHLVYSNALSVLAVFRACLGYAHLGDRSRYTVSL